MRVKSRKPPAEIFDHFAFGDLLQVVRRADDVVGDQMRHMAGDRQHQIVMLGVHHLDLAAAAPARTACSFSTARGVGARRRRQDAPAAVEQLAKPASGPDCSVPAMGWAGMKCTPLRHDAGRHRAITAPLTEPTSVTIAPGFRCGAIAFASSPKAPTGVAQDHQIGIAHAVGRRRRAAMSAKPMRCGALAASRRCAS